MRDKLVIVESPAKARTITRFLGGDVRVLASMGNVRDLPENSLGVDVRNRFQPAYVLTRNGYRTVPELKKAAATSSEMPCLPYDFMCLLPFMSKLPSATDNSRLYAAATSSRCGELTHCTNDPLRMPIAEVGAG